MLKNVNTKTNPVTTYLGLILVIPSVVVLLAPAFIEVKKDFTDIWFIPGGIAAIGTLLILSPDTIVVGVKKLFNQFLNKKQK